MKSINKFFGTLDVFLALILILVGLVWGIAEVLRALPY